MSAEQVALIPQCAECGEVWLPAVVSYTGSARVGLLFTLRRSGTSEFSGYRKYSVDTIEGFSKPK